MKVVRLKISNFRGIKQAEFLFDGHTLFVASNNLGKSTILEALDLVLGQDRLNRYPPIDEFDFYNANYIASSALADEKPVLTKILVEVVLIEPSEEILIKCASHSEFWHVKEKRVLEQSELDKANSQETVPCLRLETIGEYDPDEDEFIAKTYFSWSPDGVEGELKTVPRSIKRLFGFLYLRTLRTGSRALSLDRGSLLDIILRTKNIRTELWEKTIQRLRTLEIEDNAAEIAPVLREIEQKLSQYISIESPGNATKLFVSELTRDHLRKTMSFFMALSSDQGYVPFTQVGTGTLNTLVLALLSFIAEIKPDSVIFAMEEPEIAVPPHTQRRIAHYLLNKTTQAFVTSHSPFVIERFDPSNTHVLSRKDGIISSVKVSDASGLSDKEFKQYIRWGVCECMLGKAVIVLEGLTEFHSLPIIAQRIEEKNGYLPLDIQGVTFFYAYGESNVPKFGQFFKTLGLKTFAFYDFVKNRKQETIDKLNTFYDINEEHQYKGFEDLIAAEVPVDKLWDLLDSLREREEYASIGIPKARPLDENIRSLARNSLKSSKGTGLAAQLFDQCDYDELPITVINFLEKIYDILDRKSIDPHHVNKITHDEELSEEA